MGLEAQCSQLALPANARGILEIVGHMLRLDKVMKRHNPCLQVVWPVIASPSRNVAALIGSFTPDCRC